MVAVVGEVKLHGHSPSAEHVDKVRVLSLPESDFIPGQRGLEWA